jgi:hypothetical protein
MDTIAKSFAEALALSDHPQEPMMMHVELRLDPDWVSLRLAQGGKPLRRATRDLMKEFPDLAASFTVTPRKFTRRLAPGEIPSFLSVRVWELQNAPIEEFRELALDFRAAPLFRLRLTPQEGLCLAIHHSLTDGRLAARVALRFLELLMGLPSEWRPAPRRPEPSTGLLSWVKRGAGLGAQLGWMGMHPALHLGSPDRIFGSRHFHRVRIINTDDLGAIRSGLKSMAPGATWNEVFLSAFHLAIHELVRGFPEVAGFGSWDHIRTLIPVELRPEDKYKAIGNYSSFFSVRLMKSELEDRWTALSSVRARVRKGVQDGSARTTLDFLLLQKALGVTGHARRLWAQHRLPRRAVATGDRFWRYLDTALVTYYGKARVPGGLRNVVRGMHGFAPLMPPMGIALGIVAEADGSHTLMLKWSDATLTEAQGERLLDEICRQALGFAAV